MFKKALTIFTSIIVLIAMMTNIVLPVYAINGNISSKPPVESGVYCIQSMVGKDPEYNKDLLMDVGCASKDDNAIIQVWLKHYDLGNEYAKAEYLCQEFYLRYDYNDGCYTIIPMHTVVNGAGEVIEDSPKCVGVENPNAGTNVVQRDLCFDDNFKWVIDKCEDGQIEFTLKSTLQSNNKLKLDLCLKDNGKYGINSRVKVDNSNGKSSQKFKLSNWEPSKKNLSELKAKKTIEAIFSRMKGLPNKVPSGVYCIQSMVENNMFLDIYGPYNVDNGRLQIHTKHEYCSNYKEIREKHYLNQEFYLWCHEDGYYTIIPMYTVFDGKNVNLDFAKCIGLEDVNGGTGTKVTQRNLCFDDNCKWQINYVGNGKYKFVLKSNGLTLDVCSDGNGYRDGSRLQISNENNSNAQKFKLSFWRPSQKDVNNTKSRLAVQRDIPDKLNKYLKEGLAPLPETVKSGAYNIQSTVWDNRYLDVQGKLDNTDYNYDDQGILQIYTKNTDYILYHNNIRCQIGSEYGSDNQQFYLWRHEDGYYTIIPLHTIFRLDGQDSLFNAKCIGLENANSGVGTKVRQRDLSFDDSCKWAIDKLSDGTFEFTLKSNGLKMDVCGIDRNSLVQINTENYSPSQRFKINSCNVFEGDDNYCESIDEFLSMKNLREIEIKPEIKELTREKLSLYENLECVSIPSTVEEITDDTFSNCNNITTVICDPKWLCKFKRENLKTIVLKPSTETGKFNITKKDFEGCSNLEVLRFYCDKFEENKAEDLLKKLQVEEGALDKCTNIEQIFVYSKEDNKNIDLNLNNKFAYYFNVDNYIEIEVPDGIKKIRADRFKNKSWLMEVILPNSINEIEEGAFEGCDSLQEINLPEGITKIPARAFKDCKNLSKLTLPDSIKEIEERAFEGCEGLQEINLPEGITKIPAKAFKDCKNLSKLTLPNSVKEIEEGAFEGCEGLQEINLPEGITKIPARAFKNCKKILRLTLSSGKEEVNNELEEEVNNELEENITKPETISGELMLPNSVKEIGESAFEGCENLQEISLPEGITEIPARAFKNCKYLRMLHLHDNIEQMGDEAFEGCNLLYSGLSCFSEKQKQLFKKFDKEVIVPSDFNLKGEELEKFKERFCNAEVITMPDFDEYDAERYDELFKIDRNIKAKVIICTPDVLEKLAHKANFEAIFISEETPWIYKESFEHCKDVKIVGIPASVDGIDEGTFDNCNDINLLKCPLRLLGNFNKAKLESVIINENIEPDVENFSGCTNLNSLMIPDIWIKKENILNSIFSKCSNLNVIRSESGKKIEKPKLFEKRESCVVQTDVAKISKNDYDKYTEATILTIPQTVESIEDDAFENFSKLKTVKADPKWLKKLPKYNIENVIVPEWVSEVHEKDFKDCYNVKQLTFKSAETKLCGEHGQECDAFNNIEQIDCSLQTASTMSEEAKNHLKILGIIEGTEEISDKDLSEFYELIAIILPKTLKSISKCAFANNKNLYQVCCGSDLLKYLPKDQIYFLNLVGCQKDALQEDKLKEFKNLEKILDENNKILWNKEDLNGQDNEIQGDRYELEKQEEKEEDQQLVNPTNTQPSSEDQQLVNQTSTQPSSEDQQLVNPTNTQSSNESQQLVNQTNTQPSNESQQLVNQTNTQPSSDAQQPVNQINTQPSNESQQPVNQINTQPSSKAQQSVNQINMQPYGGGQQPVNQINTQKQNINPTTTMEDLVKADPSNKKYAEYVRKIKRTIESNQDVPSNQDTSLQGISNSIIHVCFKIKQNFGRSPYTVQILTILRLADEILNGKGAVAQVKTGEGKSFIIAVLSLVLSLRGRKIDIITSTVELAKTGEEDQRKYYDLFEAELGKGKISGVFYSERSDKGIYGRGTKFDESLYNTAILRRAIVYSSLYNFECAYLDGIFSKTAVRRGRPYDVAIVDEVDNMLLDKSGTPTRIQNQIKEVRFKDIATIIYLLQKECDSKILAILQDIFPKFNINIETVRQLKQAAQQAYEKKEEEGYFVGCGEAIIMDSFTGAVHQNARWEHGVHEMLEIRHKLPVRSRGALFCTVDHYILLRMYKRLTGLTGTIGKVEERKYINNMYGINIFEVLRNKPQHKTITKLKRPNNQDELKIQAYYDIKEKIDRGRPVLVIFNYIYEVKDFVAYLRSKGIKNIGIIDGRNNEKDEKAIRLAGTAGRVTVATIIGGRGTDIKIKQSIEQIGGLHVTVVPQMLNQRVLEQAIGRSGRNGQKGSATIFEPSMYKTEIRGVDALYENLNKIQLAFAKHIKNKWSWFYDEEEQIVVREYPFDVNEDDVLKISGASMKNNSSKGKKRATIMTAWGLLFKRMSENEGYYRNWNNCQAAYNNFIEKIDKWVASVDNIDWGDLAIKGLMIGGTIAVSVILPEVTASLKISAIVGAAVAGAIVGGLSEIHARISRGEQINWISALTRTFGGALKGSTLIMPGVGLPAKLVNYAAIAGTENYVDSSLEGDSSFDSLCQSYGAGAIESGLAIGMNSVSNHLFGKFAGGAKLKNGVKIAENNASKEIVNLSEAELENVVGGFNYRKAFFNKYPNLQGKKIVVHHSIEKKVLKAFPGLFTIEEIENVNMYRGIPQNINNTLHLSKIRTEWNAFYKAVHNGTIPKTKEAFLAKRDEIDKMFGKQFLPPME